MKTKIGDHFHGRLNAGLRAHLRRMVREGAGPDNVAAFLSTVGLTGQGEAVGAALVACMRAEGIVGTGSYAETRATEAQR